ncbi:MAG: hypothetical protein OEY23_22630, partial [Acidimicrobiia bacterium]|nr:hypothetical protein [Acidimicrobiia bacterium]
SSLAKVTGGGATMTGGALSVNTVSSAARVNIGHASSTSSPHLRLLQDGGSAYGRLEFSNVASPSDWLLAAGLTASPDGDQFNVYHSAAGNVLSVNGQGRVGVETTSPLTALHVVGSLHLQGTAQDISVQSGEQMQFGHYDGTTFTERMRIDGTGNLILSADVEAPTSARWHTSGPEDFTLVYRMNLTTTGSYLFPDSAVSGDARTSLHLPQGATITGVRARIMDSSPDTEVKVRVSRQTFDDNGWIPTILAEATSLGVTAGFTTISTSSVVQPVVNNESYGYYVEVFVPGQVNTGEVRIYRVQVEYTTPASLR